MQEIADRISRARALVFDFDGTLVDSNLIKWKGFEACFSDFPERLEEILAYCRGNNHTPRWDKFRHVYEQILLLPYTPEEEQLLSRKFEEATTRRIVQTPEVPAAERFLRQVSGTHWTGLLSATPSRILAEILESRGWTGFFREIQGAPVQKSAWLRELRGRKGWGSQDLLFFGDTPEDARSSAQAGCRFIHVGPASEAPKGASTIPDFQALTVRFNHSA